MKVTLLRLLGAGLATAGLTVACTDSSGVDGTGAVEITMQQTAELLPAESGALFDIVGLASGSLDPDTVESLSVTVTAVQFLEGAQRGFFPPR